ncbi:MAG TPA: Do family serine endopeptidase [Polyangiaceae bacterium]|nr:Do family serine endopeptidase [Polyangiaceae bacterium]
MKFPFQRLRALAMAATAALMALSCSRQPKDASSETAAPNKPGTPAQGPPATLTGDVIADVSTRAAPAVVSVASTRVARVETPELPIPDEWFFRRFFGPPGGQSPFPAPQGRERIERGIGSGVIVGPDTIVTNAHVVEGAKELEVTGQNKRVLKAKVVGTDAKSDLAVLKIEGDVSGLSSLSFADSSKLRLGQIVLAIGNPFGVGQTVTMGIVSATSRADLGIEAYEDFIQTDAAINPGNSGGALVDLDGRLVGVPTAILSRTGGYQGVGFAIPSSMAAPIVKSLAEHGHVERGFLGVTIQNLDSDLAKALDLRTLDGILVSGVEPGGPADKAGVLRGDVVLSIDGKSVQTTGQFRNLIASSAVGKAVRLDIVRQAERKTLTATLGRLSPDEQDKQAPGSDASNGSAGLTLAPLDASLRQKLDVPASVNGVVVASVQPNSPAADAGLETGDVIVEAARKPVTKPDEVSERWNASKEGLALLVWRKERTFYAVLKR